MNADRAIAVIGVACRLPGADSPQLLWEALTSSARPAAAPPSSARFAGLPDRAPVPSGVAAIFLDGIDQFDAGFFGISRREAVQMDPQHRIFLETAVEALDDAGLPVEALAGGRVGVFLGISSNDYAWLPESKARPADLHSAIGGGPVFAANRLSHCLDLRGPSMAIDTTCSSSLVATHLACRSLRERESDVVVVGGVNLILSVDVASAAGQSVPIATDGLCKAFAADADGTVRGEGCVALVLKRLSDATRDGDTVIATILGSAVNHDGRASALTAPNPQAQTEVIATACADAGVHPARITYLEAHGTGTVIGDAIEIEAAAESLRGDGSRSRPCGLGSIKAQFGHLEAAAGSAGLLRAVLSLQHGRVTPHPLSGDANPLLAGHADAIELATAGRTLEANDLIGVSSFSLGGTNAHVVLGAVPRAAENEKAPAASRSRIIGISARTEASLRQQVERLAEALDRRPLATATIDDIAFAANMRRSQHRLRKAFVVESLSDLRRELAHFRERPPARPKERMAADRMLFVFPGHGAQWAGMAQGLLASEPVFADAVQRISDLFAAHLDWSVADFIGGPADDTRMASAAYGQPALLTVTLALVELLDTRGIRPAGAIGYSAGEVAAMVVTGMLDLPEAVRLVARRSKQFGEPGEGGMLAIRLPGDAVRRIIATVAPDVAIAAISGPETTIVAGTPADIERIAARLDDMSVFSLDTGIRYAFHHPAMREHVARAVQAQAADPVAWRDPDRPFYSSTIGRATRRDDLTDEYWIAQACGTLRFDRAVEAALGDGYQILLEVAPAAVLTSDARETIRETIQKRDNATIAVPTLRRGIADDRALALAMAELFEAGCIDTLPARSGGHRAELPRYAWDRSSYWWAPIIEQAPPEAAEASIASDADGGDAPSDKVYRLEWQAENAATAERSGIDPALEARWSERAAGGALSAYAEREHEIDAICGIFARQALIDLGFVAGTHFTIAGIARDRKLEGAEQKLLARLCDIAKSDGSIERVGDTSWRLTEAPPTDPAPALAELAELAGSLPGARHEIALLARCGPRIADVMQGKIDPLTLIFPHGGAGEAAAIFSDSAIAEVTNGLVVDVIDALVRDRTDTAPLRVLEIGAGTGGTTAALRRVLDRPGIVYCCTDISPTLLRQTGRRFADWGGLETRRLDIALDPAAQGFAGKRYDLIVCANVLHATPDIAVALSHVQSLAKPGAEIVLLEATEPQRIIDLTFGLTKDWWGFADTALRPRHPLLSRDTWLDVLASAGFGSGLALPRDPGTAARIGSSVLVARATDEPSLAAVVADHVLILGEAGEISDAVAASFSGTTVEVRAQTDGPLSAWDVIVDLRCMGVRSDERFGAAALLDAARPAFEGLFELTRSLSEAARRPRKVIVVTSAAVAVSDADGAPDPLHAAFRATAETLADEHPDWPVVALDCAPATPAAVVAAIGRQLGADAASFAAARGYRRLTPVLTRASGSAGSSIDARLDPHGAHVVTGGLGELGLDTAAWLVEHGARDIVLAQRGAPDAAAERRLAALRAAGAEVEVVSVDLGEPREAAAFAASLAARERPVSGIVHAAGTFDDALLLNQDWARFARVLRPKVVAAWELYRAFAGRRLDYVVYCSSVAGSLHPAGLSNYVAANAFLTGLAERARRQGGPVTCIGWGGWAGLGMAARQSERWLERWRTRGVRGLERADLHAVLGWVTTGRAPANIQVADVAWHRCLTHLPARARRLAAALDTGDEARAPMPAEPSANAPAALDIGAIADPLERREQVRREIRRRCLATLELPDHFELDTDMPLADLGLDSLMALELRAGLCDVFRMELPQTLLFDCPSAGALVGHVMARSEAGVPA